jgi:hypothetical protein
MVNWNMELYDQAESPARRWAILHDSLVRFLAWASPHSFVDEERALASRTLVFLSLVLMTMAALSLVQAWAYRWTGAVYTQGVEV